MPTKKKRNPTDSTLRNVRAGMKRYRELAARLSDLEARVTKLEAMHSKRKQENQK